MIRVRGEYADAKIMLPEDEVEDLVIEEVQAHLDSPGVNNDIVLMPDTHPNPGAGVPVGLTMPLSQDPDELSVVPSKVGNDIGCGMTAINIGSEIPDDLQAVEDEIRDRLPLGTGDLHADNDYHLVNDFPYDECEQKLNRLSTTLGVDIAEEVEWFDGYGKDYLLDVMKRSGYHTNPAINSMGTLGGGNHFIELSRSDTTGEYWIVIHSGSRGPGGAIASQWTSRATEYRNNEFVRDAISEKYADYLKFDPETTSGKEIYEWVTGQKGESHIKKEKVREDFEGERIANVFDILNYPNPSNRDADTRLDWLDGDEAFGYFIDMIFAQTYAVENRMEMARTVMDVLGVEQKDRINSTHNYIDFDDLVVRKGATRAAGGERLVIPFNMADGAIIARGRGNSEWNCSAPHGAGRLGSRTWAKENLDLDVEREKMDGIQTSLIPDDELPGAYKDADMILEASEPTIEVEERLTPVLNIKGE